VLGSERPL